MMTASPAIGPPDAKWNVLQYAAADGSVRAAVGKEAAPTTWLPLDAAADDTDAASPLDRVFGLLPGAYAAYRDLDAALSTGGAVDPALVALCRLRIEQLVGAEPEDVADDGLSHEMRAAIRSWPTSALYTETDRAALNFTEKYVMDASSVDDADCAALRAHLSDPEVTALVIAVAMGDAIARFRVALGV
jgi:alkylhydroperoxidase family enzyme